MDEQNNNVSQPDSPPSQPAVPQPTNEQQLNNTNLPATKSKKKLVIIIIGAVLGFLIILGILIFVILRTNKLNLPFLNSGSSEKAGQVSIPQENVAEFEEKDTSAKGKSVSVFSGLANSNKEASETSAGTPADDAESIEDKYDIYECTNMTTFVLKPIGWFTLEEQEQNTKACFVSKEKIAEGQDYQTGLTINAFQNFEQLNGVSPKEFSKTFMDNLAKEGTVRDTKYQELEENFEVRTVHITINEGTENSTEVLYETIVNEDTGTLYIIWFESPTADWQENQNIGVDILSGIGVSSEF